MKWYNDLHDSDSRVLSFLINQWWPSVPDRIIELLRSMKIFLFIAGELKWIHGMFSFEG
jgi:hypothetical protein